MQAIDDAVASQAVFCEGHVLLAGETFARLRPHTAQGVNVIARAALELSRLGPGREGLEEFEIVVLREAPVQRWWSVAFGCYFPSGVASAMPPVKNLVAAWVWGQAGWLAGGGNRRTSML